VNRVFSGDSGDIEWPGNDLPDDELFVKRVEYSGDEVTVSVAEMDGTGFQSVHTWTGLEGYGELYYSSYEWRGSSGESGLRLRGASQ